MTVAYSYTRFSSKEQEKGHSKERQDASVAEWLRTHPEYELSDLTFHDAGVSAYRGKNAKKGKLAAFLKLVEQGEITPGSVLLVEEFSRFSRQNPYEGMPTCRRLFDAGVGIMDLRSGTLYNAETMRDQVIRIRLDLEWERANREQEEKSINLRKAWAAKREKAVTQGTPMTRTCPAWLQLVNGKYVVDEHRANAVRLIYAMKADGVGIESIARKLNADPDVWKPREHFRNRRGGWWPAYVIKILKNPAVIGIFTSAKLSEPIEGYYPVVVDQAVYNRVRAQRARNAEIPGHGSSDPKKAINNVFGGITKCAFCKGPMTVTHGGKSIVCEHARVGVGCIKRRFPYGPLEKTLLHLTRELEPAVVLTDQTELAREQKARHQRRQALQDDLALEHFHLRWNHSRSG